MESELIVDAKKLRKRISHIGNVQGKYGYESGLRVILTHFTTLGGGELMNEKNCRQKILDKYAVRKGLSQSDRDRIVQSMTY